MTNSPDSSVGYQLLSPASRYAVLYSLTYTLQAFHAHNIVFALGNINDICNKPQGASENLIRDSKTNINRILFIMGIISKCHFRKGNFLTISTLLFTIRYSRVRQGVRK